MDHQDEFDLMRDDADRLAYLLTKTLPVFKMLATDGGVKARDKKQVADYVQEIGAALGVHLALKNIIAGKEENNSEKTA